METKQRITVQNIVNVPIEKVWKYWNEPEHITKWYQASDDWHAPETENDLRTGGKFRTKMAARDGSMAFDFERVYKDVIEHKLIEYDMADGRNVKITFEKQVDSTKITEVFETESTNTIEMQKNGWQAIIDNFKKYVESN